MSRVPSKLDLRKIDEGKHAADIELKTTEGASTCWKVAAQALSESHRDGHFQDKAVPMDTLTVNDLQITVEKSETSCLNFYTKKEQRGGLQ
ncbi:hypothetical protein E6H37_00630 [Candidatus Bathyarchaeota archaeon]|nr:MAG: hypothetical protein E6H37_00630 [Candidatus Bathyarchaeota archaeon]